MPKAAIQPKPFPWKCGRCGQRAVKPAIMPYSVQIEHDGRSYTVDLPDLAAPRCKACGEIVMDQAANRQVTDAFQRQIGLLTPEQIRRNREAIGMTQKQLAGRLGIAEATLSRWESGGQIQQRAMDRLMRLYFALEEVRQALSDDARIGSLGATVSAPAGPESEPLTADVLSEMRDLVQTRLMSFLHPRVGFSRKRMEAKERQLTESLLPVFLWLRNADPQSLHHWTSCFQQRISLQQPDGVRLTGENRWLVVSLKSERDDDTERANRLCRLAAALDRLPHEKEASVVDQFVRFANLIKPA